MDDLLVVLLAVLATAAAGVLTMLWLKRGYREHLRGETLPLQPQAAAAHVAVESTPSLSALETMPVLGQLPRLCDCFLRSNIFIDQVCGVAINRHLVYESEQDFRTRYGPLLFSLGKDKAALLLAAVQQEQERRRCEDERAAERKLQLAQLYVPRDGEVRALQPAFLRAEFVQACSDAARGVRSAALQTITEDVYMLPMLTAEYCERLHAELQYFRDSMPAHLRGQVNSMNHDGVLLDEAGFTPRLLNPLVARLRPLCALLYGPELAALDHHRCFTVRYSLEGDQKLALHYDDSEVTCNISIFSSAVGSDLEFLRFRGASHSAHKVSFRDRCGYAVLHKGAAQHRALALTAGQRVNLIMWLRSTTWRARHGCPLCHRGGQDSAES